MYIFNINPNSYRSAMLYILCSKIDLVSTPKHQTTNQIHLRLSGFRYDKSPNKIWRPRSDLQICTAKAHLGWIKILTAHGCGCCSLDFLSHLVLFGAWVKWQDLPSFIINSKADMVVDKTRVIMCPATRSRSGRCPSYLGLESGESRHLTGMPSA